MIISIDVNSEIPIYTQLQNQIIMAIAKNELKKDDALPSVRQLASDIGINLHTVNKAYNNLKADGFLSINKKKGAVVNSREMYKANKTYEGKLDDELSILITEALVRGISEEKIKNKIKKISENISGGESHE